MMWRHGDVFVAAIAEIPADASRQPNCILAHGEMTGHTHRIEKFGDAQMFERDGQLYLQVLAPSANLVHEEHATISLPQGNYRVWQQREYTPTEIRTIAD
jgi:hypothetical protein